MRCIGGNREFGAQVERLRDAMIYGSPSIHPHELQELRAKQYLEKRRPGKLNAKFSPGALVDLEYDVQLLQVMHGKDAAALRTPRIHEALEALTNAGVLNQQESAALMGAYAFLRRLINGLRMLRGDARDLFLPDPDSDEFLHLARRMGYERRPGLTPAQQLRTDFDTCTAEIRLFVERHFGRQSLPGPAAGNVADLILSDTIPPSLANSILSQYRFANPGRAHANLRSLAGDGQVRQAFARLAVLACDMLRRRPDPDMALNNWERFAAALPDRSGHFHRLLAQPQELEILLGIFSVSQFLSDGLIRNREFLDWVINPDNLWRPLDASGVARELDTLSAQAPEHGAWMRALRVYKRREILRIGTRDMCLRAPIQTITRDISILAEGILRAAVGRIIGALRHDGRLPAAAPCDRFCLLAFGKLGGAELNYSSDIDLLAVCDDTFDPSAHEIVASYTAVMEQLMADLSSHTDEGIAYRLDFRLRPYGQSSALVHTMSGLEAYYQHAAALWEIQAALKLRPIAGNLQMGSKVLDSLKPFLLQPRTRARVAASIRPLREKAIKRARRQALGGLDVKEGAGGIRDIEFLVQGLQLVHAAERPELLSGNTLVALELLAQAGILSSANASQLHEDYVLLRRIEHYLQILDDRQTHALPKSEEGLTALAKRALGIESDAQSLLAALQACFERVTQTYAAYLG
jgi:glutamate-ammonia-ligase adenylyltransferase